MHVAMLMFLTAGLTLVWPYETAAAQRRRFENQDWWKPEYGWMASPWLYRVLAGVLIAIGVLGFAET